MEQKNTDEARTRLEKTVREFRSLESPEDMLKKAAWYDKAARVNDPELTRRLLEDMLRPKPTPSIRKQDVIQTTIQFYDTKERAKRLLLVADTTDNNEYVCFNITSQTRRGDYPEAVRIPHSPENHLWMDSYVRCNAEYIIATDSIYSDLRKTSIRIGDADFARVMERYHQMQQAGKVQRVYNTVEPKRDEFDKLKAQALEMVENYKKDPRMIAELVDFRSKFYRYSLNNTILIEKQNPYATFVASFKGWKSRGYNVNKGEHGIRIMAPFEVTYFKRGDNWVNVRRASRAELNRIYRREVETRKATYFTIGHVFDISQTNCPKKDYPRYYSMGYESVAHAALYEALKDFALKSGFDVVEKKIDSIALRGYYQPGDNSITINDKMADSEKLATMIHEFSHGLMHKTTTQPTTVAEFEAECLTNMLSHRLGLPVTETRKDFLATCYGKLNRMEYDIERSFQRISRAYNHMTEGLDKILTDRGIAIGPSREKKPEQEQNVTPQQVNENFTQGLEQGV